MPINRQCHIALLLILLLSHAALTFHVSTHVPVDQSNCEYCAGHADPGQALAYAVDDTQPSTVVEFSAVGASYQTQSTILVAYRERAPPSLI